MKPLKFRIGQRIHTASRLTVLVLVVSLLLLAITIYSAWHVKRLQNRSEEILSRNVASIQAAVELELHIQELRHQLDLYLWRHNLADLEKDKFTELASFKDERASIDGWLKLAEQGAHTPKEVDLIHQVNDGLSTFYDHMGRISGVKNEDGQKVILAEQAESILDTKVLPPAREFLSLDEKLLEASRDRAAIQSSRLAQSLLFLGVFGSIAAMTVGYGLARTISRSLVELHIPMQDVAGKLSEVTGDVVVSTSLDFDDLGPALKRVSSEVASVVEQLHARHRDIARADQLASVGQLAAGIAHEIRNPLMAMKMLVQAAQQPGSAGLDARDLQILDDEIRRLELLLTEFLDFTRPSPLKQSLVDLRGVVESTVNFAHRQADIRQVALHCEMPSEPVMIRIDATRVRQVLLNLLLNGIHAAPVGGNVWISLEFSAGNQGPVCRLKVRDDGTGIGPRQATRIFEPFYSTKETGLGLGLAVSRRIIRSHGGELGLERGDYTGAILVVELPLPGPEQEQPGDQSPPA